MLLSRETELTPEDAAKVAGYSTGHVRWLARQDKIKYRRIGHRILLIDIQSLLEYAEEMRKLGTAKHAPV